MKFIKLLKYNIKQFYIFFIIIVLLCFLALFCYWNLAAYSPHLNAFAISFSPDGKIIACSPSMYFWNTDSGKIINDFSDLDKFRHSHLDTMDFSSDGKYFLVSRYNGNRISLYETDSKTILQSFSGKIGIFSSDKNRIIAVREYKDDFIELFLWNIEEKKVEGILEKTRIDRNRKYYLKTIEATGYKSLALLAYEVKLSDKVNRGVLQIWDTEKLECVSTYDVKGTFYGVFTIKDNVFINYSPGIIRIDLHNKELYKENIDTSLLSSVSSDGKLAGTIDDGKVIVWDIKNQKKIMSEKIGSFYALSMEFSPDSKYLAVGSIFAWPKNGEIWVYDVKSGKRVNRLKVPFNLKYMLNRISEDL